MPASLFSTDIRWKRQWHFLYLRDSRYNVAQNRENSLRALALSSIVNMCDSDIILFI